ncbi:MAG: hypothetical protein KGN00_07175 [Chloroflexota bacterium]|nr:hypothetical protein [Chloroflexota bacterium]MDE3193452.1 hypothetical protein [Chloroflexota bacterium]
MIPSVALFPILVGLLVALVLLLAYRMSRQPGGASTDLVFAVAVAIGALVAPQVATVILLAMIYQVLVRRERSG